MCVTANAEYGAYRYSSEVKGFVKSGKDAGEGLDESNTECERKGEDGRWPECEWQTYNESVWGVCVRVLEKLAMCMVVCVPYGRVSTGQHTKTTMKYGVYTYIRTRTLACHQRVRDKIHMLAAILVCVPAPRIHLHRPEHARARFSAQKPVRHTLLKRRC